MATNTNDEELFCGGRPARITEEWTDQNGKWCYVEVEGERGQRLVARSHVGPRQVVAPTDRQQLNQANERMREIEAQYRELQQQVARMQQPQKPSGDGGPQQ